MLRRFGLPFARAALAVQLALASATASAMETGVGHYAYGAQTTAAAFLPPKGVSAFYGYFLFYHADSFRDGDGRSMIPDFELDAVVFAPRVVHTWGSRGDWAFSSGSFLQATYFNLEAGGQKDIARGVDMFALEPIIATTSVGNWHFQLGSGVFIPVGPYDRGALVNATKNFAGITSQNSVTWTPNLRWDLSLNPNLSFSFRNPSTEYRSGTQVGVTGGINYRPFDDLRWQLGLGGYHQEQVSDDRLRGKKVPGGFRLKKSAVGPHLTFWPTPGSALQVKWQREFNVENGPRGDLVWAICAFPF